MSMDLSNLESFRDAVGQKTTTSQHRQNTGQRTTNPFAVKTPAILISEVQVYVIDEEA